MLAFKQWEVGYVYRYKVKNGPWMSKGTREYGEASDIAIVMADSEEEAKLLVLEAGKTGAFDWAQHEFVGLRLTEQPQHAHTLVLSEGIIKMIQEHIPGSFIEAKETEEFDLPFDREA